MISSTTITRAARVVLQGYLTAAFFKVIVVDRTVLVVSRSEKVSIRLVTSTVCSSTAVLLLATTKAAQQFLSDDVHRVPVPKDVDDTAEPNARFAGGKVADTISTSKAFGAPAQPSSSPAVIESTEPAFDGPTESLSTVDSDMTLIGRDDDLAKDVFSGDRDSDLDSEWLANESTFYEHDCQATAQCLTDDELEHTLPAEYDSHTIDNLIQTMSTLSLDNVPSHISIVSLDDVASPISFADVPSHLSLDDVSSHFDLSLSFDNVSFGDVFDDESTFYEHGCQATAQCLIDDEPEHTLPAEYDSHIIDNLTRRMSTLSLDDVPSHFSIPPPDNVLSPISIHFLDNVPPHISALSLDDAPSPISTHSLDDVPSPNSTPLDNVPSHLSTFPPHHPIDISTHSLDNVASPTLTFSLDSVPSPFLTHSLDDVPSHLSPSLDNVPSHVSTISLADVPHLSPLDNVPSHFDSTLSLHNASFDDVPSHLSTHSLDDVPSHLSALMPHFDNGSIQSSKCQPQRTAVPDHAIDDLIRQMVALSLDHVPARLSKLQPHLHDYAIDTLLCKSDALPLDDNHAIDAVLQKLQALALDDNHAIDALLQKSEAPTFDNHGSDAPLHKSDTHTLDDDASQSSKYMLHDSINDSPSHRHLRRNTPLRNIEAVDPRKFNYDSPYTTMLSTPYFERWSLLFLTIVPRNHQNVSHNTPY